MNDLFYSIRENGSKIYFSVDAGGLGTENYTFTNGMFGETLFSYDAGWGYNRVSSLDEIGGKALILINDDFKYSLFSTDGTRNGTVLFFTYDM